MGFNFSEKNEYLKKQSELIFFMHYFPVLIHKIVLGVVVVVVVIVWQLDLQLPVQCAIGAYHHLCCEFESCSGGVLNTTLCDKVCQWLATGRWFSPGTPLSSINKTDHYVITEILLKVALNTIKPNQTKIVLSHVRNHFPL